VPGDRSRYALLSATLGAVLLAVSVFLPWYGVSFSASGISLAQHATQQVAAEFGNANLQSALGPLHADLGGLVGQEFTSLSAHQALEYMSIVLLVLAGLTLLDALLPLVRSGALPDGAGASLVLLGLVATACVAFRMADPPSPAGALVSLSLREGAWLSLAGAVLILAGGLWRRIPAPALMDTRVDAALSRLSGWTPHG
jgi:hypothetical protein